MTKENKEMAQNKKKKEKKVNKLARAKEGGRERN